MASQSTKHITKNGNFLKTKILWVLPGHSSSAVNMNFAKRTIPALKEAGVEIEVFYISSRTNPKIIWQHWKQAREIIKLFKPNVIHAQYGSVVGLFSTLLGLPTVVTFRGTDVNGDPAQPMIRNLFMRMFSQIASWRARKSIFVSSHLARKMIFPGDWISLPSPLDLNIFKPISKEACLRKLNLDESTRWISFVTSGNRLVKRIALAEQTVIELCRRGHKAKLLVINGVSPADVPTWLNASSCLLFTSLREGSPNAVREALACGIPVVSVLVGDVKVWIESDSFSSVVANDRVEDLADAVERAWTAPHVRRADLENVSLESHAKKILEIYQLAERY